MSNKLRTLSTNQLETLISKKVGEYMGEDCRCRVTNLDTFNLDSESEPIKDKESLHFEVELSYQES